MIEYRELDINALYRRILEQRAAANGVILVENVEIPSKNSSPEAVNFDGSEYSYDDGGIGFSFVGPGSGCMAYGKYDWVTHNYVLNALKKLGADKDEIASHD